MLTKISDFDEVYYFDFEFVSLPGERPDVVSLAWHEQSTGTSRALWRSDLEAAPPYRTDDRVLFVCFVANAELGCHLSLGWPLPKYVIDLSCEFRRITNGRTVPAGKGLLGALAYYGLDASGSKLKDQMHKRIAQGWPFTLEERAEILRYNTSDITALVHLLPKMLPEINFGVALHNGEVVAGLARMEHRGVPVDMEIAPRLADKRTWNFVRDAMVPALDAAYGVYVKGPDGVWRFSLERLAKYLERVGITGWPLTEKGKLSISQKTFEAMCKGHSQLETLRQLRHARDKMRKIKLSVGADGRNRTVLWPFKSKTSRTQPKAARWIFSPAAWLRSLIQPLPGMAVAYVDWSAMEFMVAAALSGDPVMIEFYQSGDPYLSFAKRVGAAPQWATKRTHAALRDRYKTGILAIQYGISAETLAVRLKVSVFEAHEMIAQHRALFVVYWRWAEDWLAHAFDTGVMWTPLDWQCRTGITEFNQRSIINFPVQATSADALRIVIVWAERYGLKLLAPVHDALLIESPIERIEADVTLLRELMRRASRVVLNNTADGTMELRTDASIVRYPDRYTDKRGAEVWENVLRLLAEYRAQQTATPAAKETN